MNFQSTCQKQSLFRMLITSNEGRIEICLQREQAVSKLCKGIEFTIQIRGCGSIAIANCVVDLNSL